MENMGFNDVFLMISCGILGPANLPLCFQHFHQPVGWGWLKPCPWHICASVRIRIQLPRPKRCGSAGGWRGGGVSNITSKSCWKVLVICWWNLLKICAEFENEYFYPEVRKDSDMGHYILVSASQLRLVGGTMSSGNEICQTHRFLAQPV